MGKCGKTCLENQGSIANSTPDGENDKKKNERNITALYSNKSKSPFTFKAKFNPQLNFKQCLYFLRSDL